MGWMDFDIAEWAELRDEARRGVLKALPAPVWGADERSDVVSMATDNARAAGIGNLVKFIKRDVRQWTPEGPPGVIVCNPPYGERIGEEKELVGLYRELGELCRTRAAGWTMWVFTGNPRLAGEIGLPPVEEVPLYNGKIDCRLLRFVAG
jgi:putative N6-adenine-specific DNA methylase